MNSEKQYKGIVVSHTHWDRAWYWTFEQFRIRLVETVDQVIDILNTIPQYKSFTLDGQTIVLEDYLEIKPERRQDLERLVQARKLFIGPWYILPDEFLVSGESLIRNLMLGNRIAKQFGNVMREGYVPDPFGHIRQLPQILQGFNLRSFIFMRGIGPEVEELGSEFWWLGPDGSKVLALYQRDNYGNLSCWGFPYEFGDYRYENPDNDIAVENVKKTFESIKKVANTPYLLLNNGIDHLPPQPEIPQMIEYCNQKLSDLKISHGNFSEFVDAVLNSAESTLKTYQGELIGNYQHLILLSVYSTRMYLKTANASAQILLERYAEPIAALTSLETKQDFTPYVRHAWKELLKNHPHDDICGCGIDEIHRDNVNRFDHVRQIGEYVREEAFQVLGRHIDTAAGEGKPIVIYNPLNWYRTEVVDVRLLFTPNDSLKDKFTIVDAAGAAVPFVEKKSSKLYRMEILKDAHYDVVDVQALVTVPPCGYATLYIRTGKPKKQKSNIAVSSTSIENEHLSVKIHSNGTLTIIDKSSRAVYRDLLLFEDTEDAGDEYTYSWAERSKTFTTKNSKPSITVIEKSPLCSVIRIAHQFKIPVSLTAARNERSTEKTTVEIVSTVTLRSTSRRIDITTSVVNTAKDHRLRVIFPTDIRSQGAFAGGHFDVIERPRVDAKKPTLKNKFEYYGTRHNQDFISLNDDEKGLTIANKGLPEYELIGSKKGNAIAVTLLRCVGQLSRNDFSTRHMQAGPQLPTPDAQCFGEYSFEYAIIPHQSDWLNSRSYIDAFNFVSPIHHWNVRRNTGLLPNICSMITVEPKELVVSAIKRSEDKSGMIVRFYNISQETVKGSVRTHRSLLRADVVNLNEEFIASAELNDDRSCSVQVEPKKIVTLKFTYKP